MVRNIILGLGIVAFLFAILIFSGKLPIGRTEEKPQGDVFVWGTIPSEYIDKVFQDFNSKSEGYIITYRYIDESKFQTTLVEALAEGVGPDLIIAPHQILLKEASRISFFPSTNLREKDFKDRYIDSSYIFYDRRGAVALPIFMDPMVLLYNRSLLSRSGVVSPPVYWDEITALSSSLTIRPGSQFSQSAIALGTPNTPHAKDILMTMVYQLGQTPVQSSFGPDGSSIYSVTANKSSIYDENVLPLVTSVRFFSQFGDSGQLTYSWDDSLGKADDVFVAEKLAMYIGYASDLALFKARNPRGEYEMTTLPQVRGYNTFVTGTRLYGVAVLKSTKNPFTAFSAQLQISGEEMSGKIASSLGVVPAYRSFLNIQGLDAVISRSALAARVWLDLHPKESEEYTKILIGDIINYRYGVVDATNLFVSRLRDLYTEDK
ncbi:MAG: hypothetical protein RI935_642 [Candidatus Parcubacteria bacterium]|jgi:ABC-type glycerol-3-phosphate transport system substrate-binding protein